MGWPPLPYQCWSPPNPPKKPYRLFKDNPLDHRQKPPPIETEGYSQAYLQWQQRVNQLLQKDREPESVIAVKPQESIMDETMRTAPLGKVRETYLRIKEERGESS